jgi:hypothetical protein
MRKLISILVAALFAAVTFSAYATDPAPAGDTSKATKPAKKKKKSKSSTSSGAPAGGAVQTAPVTGAGRGDNTGAPTGGAVTTEPQSGPARGK